jgi:fibronectin type 3 domain-containing protein
VQGNQVTYTDAQDLTFGHRYTYVVVALDEKGRPSPPSNRVVVSLLAAPVTPPRLEAQPGDAQVRLTWDAPPTLADGSPAPADLVYDVFRATTPGTPAGRPLNLEPVAERPYVDLAVQNDVTYYYAVRARLGPGGPQSGPSAVATATPEDATPPAQPRGLVAVLAGPSVRLAWQAVPDPDVAGYVVYRSTTAGRGHERLTATPQAGTTYVDTDVRPGQTYFYVVTAVDRSKRANESVPSQEASVTLP